MPSSISSSEHPQSRVPEKRWWLLWTLSLLLAVAAIVAAELFWRSRGHRPAIVDDLDYWSFHRTQVSDGDDDRVVLLGGSRMQFGFATDVFRSRYPDLPLTQLAIDGRKPIAVLRDLAEDEQFLGTVICALTADAFEQLDWDEQQEYVDHFHRRYALRSAIDSVIGSYLQGRLVVLNPNVRLDQVLRLAVTGDPLPAPLYVVTRTDRSRPADFTLIDADTIRARRVQRRQGGMKRNVPSPEVWLEDVARVEEFVRKIEQRGGRVVFVRFPTSGEHWELDEQQYPKSNYWDRLAESTSAETIHFADHPELSQFELPDTSHLDVRDTAKFTEALLEHLEQREVLPERVGATN